jgi:drug/metabolite transporter (DMT)-like permease
MPSASRLPTPLPAVLALLLNALIWGVSWWPFRVLQSHGLHPLWSTAAIYLVLLLALLAFYPASIRPFFRRPDLLGLALAAGCTNVGFNWAVSIGDVVRVVLLFYLMPAWTVLVAWALLGEKPGAGALLRLLLAMAGVAVVLKAPGSGWPVPASLADWLALAAGLCFALTNVLLRRCADAPAAARMLAMFGGGALLASAAGVFGMLQGAVPAPALALAGLPVVLALGLAFMVSNAALQFGAARLPPATTSLVMLTEILFASLSALLLGAASLEPRVWWGGGLIVAAAMLAAMAPEQRPKAA